MSDIIRYYDKRKNPDEGVFPFVPLADITDAEWKALEEWQQASIDACGYWLKSKPRPAKDEHVDNDADPTPGRAAPRRSNPAGVTNSDESEAS